MTYLDSEMRTIHLDIDQLLNSGATVTLPIEEAQGLRTNETVAVVSGQVSAEGIVHHIGPDEAVILLRNLKTVLPV